MSEEIQEKKTAHNRCVVAISKESCGEKARDNQVSHVKKNKETIIYEYGPVPQEIGFHEHRAS